MSLHPDQSYQGTGKDFARIDLGPIGTLVIEDDGCHDLDTLTNVEYDADGRKPLSYRIHDLRAEHGDEWVAERLGELAERLADAPTTDGGSATAWDRRGPPTFVCTGCHLTWPRTKNQSAARDGTGVCPECADDEGP